MHNYLDAYDFVIVTKYNVYFYAKRAETQIKGSDFGHNLPP